MKKYIIESETEIKISLVETLVSQEEHQAALEKIDELKGEIDDLNTEISNLILEDKRKPLTVVRLNLDTLHFRLENGNLQVQEKLEQFIRENSVNEVPTLW